jgi:WD40 repeat protein
MPIATRTFRVFVSSTFEDLKAERDALQRDVFPRLRKLCEANNARFQAIDLRWGVRDEAALDQQTMEICLREIERCQQTGIKPNFIVLLGERYGWSPPPARIEAAEFKRVCGRVADTDKRLIDGWYERDDNAVPPEFLLKPRTGEFADKDRWGEVERKLHRTLREAAQEARLAQESLIKYEASATHQEILKGLGQSTAECKHVFAFLRASAEGATEDPKLAALKEELRHKLPEGNVHSFQIGEIEKLCTNVEESLKKVILDETSRFTSRDALELEIEAHDRFAADRCRIFVGRGDALTAISDYLSGPERQPLVLHGASGSGKSAVMAKASDQHKGPGRVIRRFIGASPESASGHALLTSLCKQIAPGETPVDYYQLEKAFQERLAGVTEEQPLVLFIDALDQLSASDPARAAIWLPAELPPHVKLIVSTTDEGERRPKGLPVRLQRMTRAEGGHALDELLGEARRTLQPWQRETVLAHFDRCGLPLYLKLAAEESRLWKSFSFPDACMLGEGIAAILDTLFDRLASNTNHGQVLVDRSLGYLASARYGLTESEMLDVLTSDDTVWNDFDKRKHHEVSERRLPVVVWSRLSLDLEPYLTERAAPGGTVIAFYHRQLAEQVAERFLTGTETQARHAGLTRYFSGKPAWLDQGHKMPNSRRAVELVFHQRGAKRWVEAEATLFDCPFLFAKVAAGMVQDLDDDYRALLRDAPERELRDRDTLQLMQGALRLSLHVLANDAAQLGSQMRGRLIGHQDKPGIATFLDNLDTYTPRPWLRPLWPTLEAAGGPLLRVLEGRTGSVDAVALSADGKRAVFCSRRDKTLRVWDLESSRPPRVLEGHAGWVGAVAISADGKRAVSGSSSRFGAASDNTVRIWDLEGNQPPITLEGHTGDVNAVAVSADGKRAISGSWDKTVRVWDLVNNRSIRILEGHTDNVTAVALSADGKRAVSGSWDKTVRVWDLRRSRPLFGQFQESQPTGTMMPHVVTLLVNCLDALALQPSRILEGHAGVVSTVALSADGKRAVSGSDDHTVRVWDLEGNQPPRLLEDHTLDVKSVALSADGQRAVSGSGDKTVRVWDLGSDQPPRVLKGHTDWVHAVAISGDGRRAVSGSVDTTLRVWDLEGNRPPSPMRCPSGPVIAVALSGDGRRAVSGSYEGSLRVWDLKGNEPPSDRILEGHTTSVRAVALTADGKRAVSASRDNTVRVWDLEGDETPCVLEGFNDLVGIVALSADGRRAVSGSSDRTVRIWDLDGNRPPSPLGCHSGPVSAVAISADGKCAITGAFSTLNVWDLDRFKPPRILEGHTGWVTALALSCDGQRAISGFEDTMVQVWNLSGNRPPCILEGHTEKVNAVALSDDGRHAVSGSGDQTLRVWDLETRKCLTVFVCDAAVDSCAWVGELIMAGDSIGHVHLFAWEE